LCQAQVAVAIDPGGVHPPARVADSDEPTDGISSTLGPAPGIPIPLRGEWLEALLSDLIEGQENQSIVLDMCGVKAIDAAVLGVVERASTVIAERGGELVVKEAPIGADPAPGVTGTCGVSTAPPMNLWRPTGTPPAFRKSEALAP